MNFAESVSYMQGLLRFGEKYGNERFEALLERLGNPHRQFKAVHIAGTKGKGSTTTFAASVLSYAGYRTGSYFSPYVYDLRERIRIDSQMIPREDFARLVTLIQPHVEYLANTDFGPTTEFELKTAVAFCYFAEKNVDYAVLEVGLGGRLDATNVIPPPVVSVITNIGYDHMEILGDTLELIAAEKAGIVKTGSLCVTGIQSGPALETVKNICVEREVPLFQGVAERHWQADGEGGLTIRTPVRSLAGLKLKLRGRFQHANAGLAMLALDVASIPGISDSDARSGLEAAYAPGRLEVIHESSPTVILDAAHNELAAAALMESLRTDFHADRRPVILVCGFSRRHDPGELLKTFLDLKPKLLLVTEPSFRPRPAEDAVAAASDIGYENVNVITSVVDATRAAVIAAAEFDDALIVVTGSFFTVGDLAPELRNSLFDQV
jgi:dihydrofolate synthase / folylpolyglutamate synthase